MSPPINLNPRTVYNHMDAVIMWSDWDSDPPKWQLFFTLNYIITKYVWTGKMILAQCASKGHKLPSQPTLSATVQKSQCSGCKAPITVVFYNDATNVSREVTGQWTVVKLVSGWIFSGHSLGSQPRRYQGSPSVSSRRTVSRRSCRVGLTAGGKSVENAASLHATFQRPRCTCRFFYFFLSILNHWN